MNYEILETHCVFSEGKLIEVAVLWNDHGFVRATYSNLNPKSGYAQLTDADDLSPTLFQRIDGGGVYLDDARKKPISLVNENGQNN